MQSSPVHRPRVCAAKALQSFTKLTREPQGACRVALGHDISQRPPHKEFTRVAHFQATHVWGPKKAFSFVLTRSSVSSFNRDTQSHSLLSFMTIVICIPWSWNLDHQLLTESPRLPYSCSCSGDAGLACRQANSRVWTSPPPSGDEAISVPWVSVPLPPASTSPVPSATLLRAASFVPRITPLSRMEAASVTQACLGITQARRIVRFLLPLPHAGVTVTSLQKPSLIHVFRPTAEARSRISISLPKSQSP